jgi:hypothetical protein
VRKETLEKVFEYASMPVHGTLSRKLRKGIKIQINEGRVYEDAVLFLGDEFIRLTEKKGGESVNTYVDWDKVASVTTLSPTEE